MHQTESASRWPRWHDELDGDWGFTYRRAIDSRAELAPLIRQLEAYDQLRLRLEKEGGSLADVTAITALLQTKFQVAGYRSVEAALTDGPSLRRMLDEVGDFNLYLDVRRLDTGMPVYYLCRTRRDWWAEYDLVVEDLYRSPGYAFLDERFARLMRFSGHESYFLRLSPFRDGVAAMLQTLGPARSAYADDDCAPSHSGRGAAEGPRAGATRLSDFAETDPPRQARIRDPHELRRARVVPSGRTRYECDQGREANSAHSSVHEDIDRVLYDVGRYVLSAAWHEDQTLGLLAAKHFQLPNFARAIEILYLALSGDLCDLRALAQSELVVGFLRTVYPQPAISSFLSLLASLDGAVLNQIPDKALKLYSRLSRAFGQFIEVPVTWGHRRVKLPLYKLIFANTSRLAQVAVELQETPHIRQAADRLENESKRVIEGMLI